MKKAILYVFSGTGNTYIAAEMIRRELIINGYEVVLYKAEHPFADFPSPKGYDLAGFGYPVHAFNTPQMFMEFIRLLPAVNGIRSFIFKVSGEPFAFNNSSSARLHKTVAEKGFNVVWGAHLLMPYNIMFRYRDELAKQMYLYTQAACKAMVKHLMRGDTMRENYSLGKRVLSFLFRIQQPAAKWNGRIYSIDKKRCVKCMRCVHHCPGKNISLKGNVIAFDHSCAMCMRCVMYCPKGAVRPGILRLWSVNGGYDYSAMLKDETICANFINENTSGYFSLFRKYYREIDKDLLAMGIKPPRGYSDPVRREDLSQEDTDVFLMQDEDGQSLLPDTF